MKYLKPEIIEVGKVIDITFGGMGWGGDILSTSNRGGGGSGQILNPWGAEVEEL